MASKIIAVVGATGNQGSSVVKTFVALPNWHVRAITRNTSSGKAKELAALGAELVQADLSDVQSLSRAFQGAHAVFVLTDFWATYATAKQDKDGDVSSQLGYEREVQHSKNAANAATGISTLERFVYSALGPMKEASGGKYAHSYHWESKAAAVNYIEKEQPELAKKTSFIYPGAYSTNAFLLPKRNPESGEYSMVLPGPATMEMPIIDAPGSTGLFVRALIEDEKPGVKLMAYDSLMTMGEVLATWSRVSGTEAKFVQMTLQGMHEATGMPLEVLDGAAFLGEYHYMAGLENVIEPHQLKQKVVTPSYEEFLKTQSRDYLLGGEYPQM